MKPYRVFLAHKKDCLPDDATRIWLSEVLLGALGDRDVHVVCGFEDYNANFATYGGWSGWIRMVGSGVRMDGSPTYDAYIVPEPLIGKATYDILTLAIAGHRRVLQIEYREKVPVGLRRISGVRLIRDDPSRGAGDYAEYAELVPCPGPESG